MKRIVWIVAILTIVTVFFLAITGVTSIDSLAALYESEGFFPFAAVAFNLTVIFVCWTIKSWEVMQVLAVIDLLLIMYALFEGAAVL